MQIAELVNALQMSVAPVLLVSGIGFLALVMSNRFARVIDRIRALIKLVHQIPEAQPDDRQLLVTEINSLYNRANLLRIAAILAGSSIFCVGLTIFAIFSNLMFGLSVNWLAEAAFVLSLIFLLAFVIIFIHDFGISLRAVRFEIKHGLAAKSSNKGLHLLSSGEEP